MTDPAYRDLTQLGRMPPLPASPDEAVLERVAQSASRRRLYLVRFTAPEFTTLCPVTGQPDFAHLVIDYVPDERLVESKSLKLYLGAFRNHGAFHEDCTLAHRQAARRGDRAARGCASAAIGIRAAACRSTSSTRPARRPKGCGCPTRASRPIADGAERTSADAKAAIRDEALGAGLRRGRLRAAPSSPPEARRASRRISRARLSRRHGLARGARRRARRSRSLWPEVKTVVVLGLNYGARRRPACRPRRAAARQHLGLCPRPRLSRRGQVAAQGAGAQDRRGLAGALKVFVDTAPVMEKPLAMRAGLGWQGKHTNLVSRDFGSWLFLGEIYLSLELAARCARGRSLRRLPRLSRCLPDRGFPRALSARCAALHLLSHDRAQGPYPAELRAPIGNRIYGCDDCLAVCPWNKFAQAARETRFARARRRTPNWPSSRRWTMRLSARVSPARRSSASAATASSATC